MQFSDLTIGVPKEILKGEKRVAVTPETAEKLIEAGAEVLVETGAGEKAFFSDDDYEKAGVEIVGGPEKVYPKADVILKVKEPQFNEDLDEHEADMLAQNSTLISFLHPANSSNHGMVRKLAENGVTSYTLDGIPRISRAQSMDALTSMSTVAGYRSVITGADHLQKFVPMIPTAIGTMGPANVLVIGSGVAGLQAIGTANRLGARVKALDIRPEANEQAQSLGAEVIDFDLPEDLATTDEGYARRLPDEWYEKERETIKEHVVESDLVVLAALIMGEEAPVLVTEDMVEDMDDGSVIVDIAIDQGGNCELSKPGEEIYHDNVMISAILNMPASLPLDSTNMLAKNIHRFFSYLVEEGELAADSEDEIIESTLVTEEGEIVHRGTLKAMGRL
ncbi:NAD(P) transhydrogenase subunit alpha [Halarsenatibacter silvermanii]|uniref:proton-translocating NAD(P)(+) transhydrogenase n=1 Tax=Halarsenatibacter silvermanii TaxID=321763 RepID=A0A1G9Q7B0_9FIRM|nr:NAD(P) transhydrogenase subunit alpha [Halarsenatibacter silvermanii]SDM06829.1 NAD(P) transhydrogenase subunit alpha [Halarsenatibacter silvermanii]